MPASRRTALSRRAGLRRCVQVPTDCLGSGSVIVRNARRFGALFAAVLSLLGCSAGAPQGIWETKGPSAGPLQYVRLHLRDGGSFSCDAVFTEGGTREEITGTWAQHAQKEGFVLELRATNPPAPRLFGGRTSVLTEARRDGRHFVLPRGFSGEAALILSEVEGK